MTNDPRIVMRPVVGLRPYDRNPRTHTSEQIAKVAQSIQEYVWTNPIMVDRDGTIVAGHARLEAAKSLGLAEVPTIGLDPPTLAQARAYENADNQLAMDAAWDEEILRVELAALQGLDFDLSLTGFDAGEIVRLLVDLARIEKEMAALDRDFRQVKEAFSRNTLNLAVVRAYLARLLENARIVRHLSQHHAELLGQFHKIVETESLEG